MSDEKIKAGDTVRLKSGGPLMTVSSVGRTMDGEALHAWCDWFDKEKKMNGAFPLTSLRAEDN
jgi:uncharacterized protein YodC (DUF2158 family)